MLRKLVRTFFAVAGAIFGFGIFTLTKFILTKSGHAEWVQFNTMQDVCIGALFVIIFSVLFFRLTPALEKRSTAVAGSIESDLQKISTNELFAGTIGLIAGLIIAYLISQIYVGITIPYMDVILNIVTYIILGYLGIIIATRKVKDVRNLIASPKVIAAATGRGKNKGEYTPKIFDTSVIIDGRISDIMRTGFIEGPIVIPEFVLLELQHIADSSDTLKRQRGRRGLDILNKIQAEYGIEIYATEEVKSVEEIPDVYFKLL
ncbi:MAG: hypothetical protein KBS66_06055 [Eubacterium sp.]|nr:hypothetical protein [Candidatus Colimonas fimequi]